MTGNTTGESPLLDEVGRRLDILDRGNGIHFLCDQSLGIVADVQSRLSDDQDGAAELGNTLLGLMRRVEAHGPGDRLNRGAVAERFYPDIEHLMGQRSIEWFVTFAQTSIGPDGTDFDLTLARINGFYSHRAEQQVG